CNVCGDIFDTKSRKGFARHCLEHDLALLFQALYDQEERDLTAKRRKLSQESAIKSPVVAESTAKSVSGDEPVGRRVAKFLENERVKKKNAEILEQRKIEAIQKKIEEDEKKHRKAAITLPCSIKPESNHSTQGLDVSSSTVQKNEEIAAVQCDPDVKSYSPEVEIQNTGTKLKIKFTKLYKKNLTPNECGVKINEETKKVDELITSEDSATAITSEPLKATSNVTAVPSQEKPNGTTAPATTTAALSRECPHCHECMKSPWLLVGHMVMQHGDKLTFLERRILPLNADKNAELCESFETFARNSCCAYCQDDKTVFESKDEEKLKCDVFTHVLLHHRDRLLEYRADISECDLRFEVVSQIGDEPPKKYKIRVKTKLKNKND
uniref:C2H2-type domain-containing protein n=1 Tax=Romanomermis culicivorax TaxID=13658 RepID=A0A915HWD9_ROMCU